MQLSWAASCLRLARSRKPIEVDTRIDQRANLEKHVVHDSHVGLRCIYDRITYEMHHLCAERHTSYIHIERDRSRQRVRKKKDSSPAVQPNTIQVPILASAPCTLKLGDALPRRSHPLSRNVRVVLGLPLHRRAVSLQVGHLGREARRFLVRNAQFLPRLEGGMEFDGTRRGRISQSAGDVDVWCAGYVCGGCGL